MFCVLFRIMMDTIHSKTIQLYERNYMTKQEYEIYVHNLLVLRHTLTYILLIDSY